jgi:hypothetical protein
MTEPKRHVFVSYARADIARVDPIIKALRQEGLDVWLDLEDIAGATFWRKEIVEAIAECSVVLFFATKPSCSSDSVSKELALANEEKKPILPVFLDDVEISTDLRYQIAGLQHIDWFINPSVAQRQISAALQRYVPRSSTVAPALQGRLQRPRQRNRWQIATLFALLGVALIASAAAGIWWWSSPVSQSSTREKTPVKQPSAPLIPAAVSVPKATPMPRLASVWQVENTTATADYSPYRGLRVRYRLLLTQNGGALEVRGEKIGEVRNGQVNELTGRGKTPIHLTGHLESQASGKFKAILNGDEGSTQRGDFSTMFELRVDSSDLLSGSFSSTAANASGQTIWMSEAVWRTNGWPAR